MIFAVEFIHAIHYKDKLFIPLRLMTKT